MKHSVKATPLTIFATAMLCTLVLPAAAAAPPRVVLGGEVAQGVKWESFQVGPPGLMPPTLERIRGSNRTIQLAFSEAITPAQTLDPVNFIVTKNLT